MALFKSHSLTVSIVLTAALCGSCLPTTAASADETRRADDGATPSAAWPPTDLAELLQQLKRRDAELENRILKIEERWVERIDPRAMQAQSQFNDLKFGQKNVKYPDPSTLPDAYDQPHRRLMQLIVRGPDITFKIVGELEKRLNPDYGTLPNKGFISTNVGGTGRSYSPETKMMHLVGSNGGMLQTRKHAFEWCLGHGFAKLMDRIETIELKDDRILVEGTGTAFQIRDCTFQLQIDRDLIVRHAVVSTPVRAGGSNDYRVTTKGAVRPAGAPAIAEEGISQRVLKPAGKPERLYTKHDIAFVSLSAPLSDDEYAKAVAFETADSTRKVDMRPLSEREVPQVSKLNDEILTHAKTIAIPPFKTEELIEVIARLSQPETLSDAEFAALKSISKTRRLPQSMTLRHFTRYVKENLTQHGSWIHLSMETKEGSPFILPIRSHVVFERPHTLLERDHVETVRSSGGMTTLGRLITFFNEPVLLNQSPKLSGDYQAFAKRVQTLLKQKKADELLKLYHKKGKLATNFPQTEMERLVQGPVATVTFEPRKFIGEPAQWTLFQWYGPNVPVEGYLKFDFGNAEDAPLPLWMEVGAVDGKPCFVHARVNVDNRKKHLGKKMSGPVSTGGGYFRQRTDGRLESISNITAPKEVANLREANHEIWLWPEPR